MKNIIKVYLADTRRISKNVVAVVIVMGLSILPSLYAWFNIFSNWDPYGPASTSNLKVVVVSIDEGAAFEEMELNIGDTVIEALKSNDTIGWIFAETAEEAVEGVQEGNYYAALVIPENFSQGMISFLGGEVEHPQILYYENEKKNAIAPKITDKAKTAVQEQVNATFVGTLAESVMKAGNVLAGVDSDGILETVEEKLTDLRDDMIIYAGLLNSFEGITNSAAAVVNTAQTVVPDLNGMVESGQNSLNGMQGVAVNSYGNAEAMADVVSYSFDMIDSALGELKNSANAAMTAYQQKADAEADLTVIRTMLPYIKNLFQHTVAGWEDEQVKAQVSKINASFAKLEKDISDISEGSKELSGTVEELNRELAEEITACRASVKALKETFQTSIKPELRSAMGTMQTTLVDVQALLNGIDGDFGEITEILADYEEVLKNGTAGIARSRKEAENTVQSLNEVIAGLKEMRSNPQYEKIAQMLSTNPALLSGFLSSPVGIHTKEIYPIVNYGSAMTPFYTILALWVGALILVAIIHVKVLPEKGLENVKNYQKFFGRYLTFFLIGQAQTLITVLGELFYIKIQCKEPVLFWLAAAVTSLVFTLLIYSLTVAFGNVGEALAVIIMVIQVAGAGGTFPIETLPAVYQKIYQFLPFTHGMNAMRETIAGMYGDTYFRSLGILGIYLIISLIIGLVVAIPFRRVNEIIEESKQKSNLMI